LALALHTELRGLKGGALLITRSPRPEALQPAYEALLARPDVRFVVGTIDDVVVGFGITELENLADQTVLGVITELFVEEPAREIGVGELILDDLVGFCGHHRCVGIDASALPGHRSTKNFFEQQGFTARALVMHRSLDPDPRHRSAPAP
jgi:GNAT superfamily N-acetyltransferase